MSTPSHPRKRAAFEPAAGLASPPAVDPAMRRPASTVAGVILVLLRAAAGVLWGVAVAFGLPQWIGDAAALVSGGESDSADAATVSGDDVGVLLAVVGVVFVVQVVFGILVLFGNNVARVTVMVISVLSITASFVQWWDFDQDITVRTSLITLSLDILVLLALSSRSSAAYARRRERRG